METSLVGIVPNVEQDDGNICINNNYDWVRRNPNEQQHTLAHNKYK